MPRRSPLITAEAGIIPALDVDDAERLKRIVAATCEVDGVVGYKLGAVIALRLGLGPAIDAVRGLTDLPVLYDHQKAGTDIPSMSDGFTKACRDAGADGLVLFPLAGREAVRQFAERTRQRGMTPLVGGELPYPEYRARHGGFVHDGALGRILDEATAAGVDHVIIPANEPRKVRRHVGKVRKRFERPSVFLPGIGTLGGSIDDAFGAADGCRRYAIIGRSIIGARRPATMARRFAEEALKYA
ncbi:MAG: orotidine 5'-phosphate decarboxylase [Alphaproteobacteria bacterium]|jgi:orotidine-5'-phosphate decarboxylase|nr:orotidine 5'-phosphate decarboxylase [Alphaproteobacteria bacterium]